MAYKTIVVALDLSAESASVIQKAQVQLDPGGSLLLMHVVAPMPMAFSGELMMEQPMVQDEQIAVAKEHLLKLAASFSIPDANCRVAFGDAQHEIHAWAEEKQADLIVVGSHGRHGLALLFGSTANAVLHGAGCDVLAVRLKSDN